MYLKKGGRVCSACVHARPVSVLERITQALSVLADLALARGNRTKLKKRPFFFLPPRLAEGGHESDGNIYFTVTDTHRLQ